MAFIYSYIYFYINVKMKERFLVENILEKEHEKIGFWFQGNSCQTPFFPFYFLVENDRN